MGAFKYMPIFFFNIRTRDDVIEDKLGRQFSTAKKARLAAIADAKLFIDALFDQGEIGEITVEICDRNGAVVDTLTHSAIFPLNARE
jgi:hypothetical protein